MTLKKVDDGIVEFDGIWDDAHSNPGQKDKLGEELKKSINKLQRFRVQIREWIGGDAKDVKNKDKLEQARKRIEFNMQRFKEFERELKTKAYSTFALAKDEDEDEEAQEKRDAEDYIQEKLDQLNGGVEGFEADIEAVQMKKNPSMREKEDVEEKKRFKERHEWHIAKLECLLRACNNDTLDLNELSIIKESVDFYIEAGTQPDYYHDETLYDNFEISEYAAEQEVAQSRKVALDQEVAEKCMLSSANKKGTAKKEKNKKAANINPAAQKNANKTAEPKRRVIGEDGEQKISEDQLVTEAEEFICKICYVHVVGISPKLTKCSHLFCGDCLAKWFDQHPEIQSWAQRAKTAGDVMAHTVPCPVCKTALNEQVDLHPICPSATQSEHVLLWRMLSSVKVMCANHPKVEPGKKCDWIGEYGQYQAHIQNCKNEPLNPPEKEATPPAISNAKGNSAASNKKSNKKEDKAASSAKKDTAAVVLDSGGSTTASGSTTSSSDRDNKTPANSEDRNKNATSGATAAVSAVSSGGKAASGSSHSSWGAQGASGEDKLKASSAAETTASSASKSSTAATASTATASSSAGVGLTPTRLEPFGSGSGGASSVADKNKDTSAGAVATAGGGPATAPTSNGAGSLPVTPCFGPSAVSSSSNASATTSGSSGPVTTDPAANAKASKNKAAAAAQPHPPDLAAASAFKKNKGGPTVGAKKLEQDFTGGALPGAAATIASNGKPTTFIQGAQPIGSLPPTNQMQQQNMATGVTVNGGPAPLQHSAGVVGHQREPNAMQPPPEAGVATARFEPRGENTIDVHPGQTLSIIEEHNSGWTYVRNETTNLSGWVPAWVVSKLPPPVPAVQRSMDVDPPNPMQPPGTLAQGQMQHAALPNAGAQGQAQAPPEQIRYPRMPALAPFEGNSANELSVQKGELIEVVERHETGWTFGKKGAGGHEGWFPDWVIQSKC